MNNQGCIFLEAGINFDLNTVCDCCISHNDGRGLPVLIDNYNGESINWEKLFEKKSERICAQQEKNIYECDGCYHLCEYKFGSEHKISEFHFSHCRVCNAKCIYCSDEYSGGSLNYDTYPIIKDLIDKGFYKAGGEATFQGGEPSLMQNFDKLINLFIENGTNVRVHTSGIKYSPTTAEALRQNKGSIVISLDSASKEIYKKIKQVDAYDIVINNIKKYSEAALENKENIIIKYIIIPGINDNIREINKFFKMIKKLNIKVIALDVEVQYARKYGNKDVSPHIYILKDYFENLAEKYNIRILIYSFLSYVLKNRDIEKFPIKNNKFFFVWTLNKYNQKYKNLIYKR